MGEAHQRGTSERFAVNKIDNIQSIRNEIFSIKCLNKKEIKLMLNLIEAAYIIGGRDEVLEELKNWRINE